MPKTTKRDPAASASSTPSGRVSKRLRSPALELSIGYQLRRAQYSTYAHFTAAMEPLGIRPSQFAVLTLIHANPGVSQQAICGELGIQKTNFVSVLNTLEERGFTERRKLAGDRRASAVHLTVAGEKFVTDMEQAHAKLESRLARRLGVTRTRNLIADLIAFASEE